MKGLLYYFRPFDESWGDFVDENGFHDPDDEKWNTHARYWMADVLFGIEKQFSIDMAEGKRDSKVITLMIKLSDLIEEVYGGTG